ncbi:MAG: phage portal protein [Lachnospiraceae bacterium]|nr:phage portal protein [Lachnospiraceae bacterium]
MLKFVYPKSDFDEKHICKKDIYKLITMHVGAATKIRRNQEYYKGKHDIENRTRAANAPNAKVACNHAKDISDVASGYFMGSPITYENTGEAKLEPLLVAFDNANVDETDAELALDLSINGLAYEYLYVGKDSSLRSKVLDAGNCFMVVDDTIEENELFGVYYWKKKDDKNGRARYVATILTEHYKYELVVVGEGDKDELKKKEKHHMGEIPLIEYLNNKYGIGDFEQQIPLIDAYNTLMSDRINDVEQFIDAILILYGASLGDDEAETAAAAKELRENKLLELPEDAKAEYLLRSLDENGVEVLREAIKEDIYTFSHVPNITDENFAGNASGVAMEYKLLGLEMLTTIKTRYFRKGLRKRIRIFCHFLKLKQILMESNSIVPSFNRTLPKNLVELSTVIANLKDSVTDRTLLKLLPFVEDPDEELERLAEEKASAAKSERALFGNSSLFQSDPESGVIMDEQER